MANWMRTWDASGIGGELDIHHGSMWHQVPYNGTTLYHLEHTASVVPPPVTLFANRFGSFTNQSNFNSTPLESGIARQPHYGFCMRAQQTIPQVLDCSFSKHVSFHVVRLI
jgi:hypothetical protein